MGTTAALFVRPSRARFSGVVLMLALFLVCSPRAFAHAVLVRSTPADGAVLHTGNITFTLDYNSRIDERRSVLHLTGSGNQEIAQKGINIPQPQAGAYALPTDVIVHVRLGPQPGEKLDLKVTVRPVVAVTAL